MRLTPAMLRDHARSEVGRKQLRYVGVSVVFVPVGQVLIQVLGSVFDGNFTLASIVAAAILTVPNFFANKLLVWKDTSRDNLRTQVVVFWVAAMLGVSLATGLTYVVQQLTVDSSSLMQRVSVFVAQMTGFGIVWVGRYLVLDKWLFRVTHHGEEPSDDELDEIEELHGELPI
ncbi:MAG: GtrA family protein [Acidimicrobiales bacterium]